MIFPFIFDMVYAIIMANMTDYYLLPVTSEPGLGRGSSTQGRKRTTYTNLCSS